MIPTFKLVLCDLTPELVREWRIAFAKHPEVEIHHGGFTNVPFDCVVSAANSFGLMDGGVDGAITDYFGEQMMYRVQDEILENYAGEQPVGTSFIVRGTSDEELDGGNKIQFVAHTPTMIVPRDISNTTNVYMAMKAMLLAVEQHNITDENKINVVVCTGLGTGAGRVSFKKAAIDMAKAYTNFKVRPNLLTWTFGLIRYNQIVGTVIPDEKKCYCGEPVDITNINCVAFNLCKEHEMDT